ncbi:beta-lactamase domain-containing protein [Pochonia chlamydosporia 170]|uniref:Beta-lactamase domain-containing protein n=1 Tax=Pochonia chlamydosporia 170 TaxID=1380566 RepID=A0A179FID7_METCM|nr:beta-lactamase domain-containing protein [Pochonia chlamydosporia 170]OAQ65326.1 beta-lactamase domain-containing protein [Pochonia chlamydosporia 170]
MSQQSESNKAGKLKTLRILNPYPNIYAYYDGRTGHRYHSDKPNWLDNGAFTLGVASYSIICNDEALIFDAHITVQHAAAVLRHVHSLGITKVSVVYSHAHTDHIAGARAFKDCTIISSEGTASRIEKNREKLSGIDPPIDAVVPDKTFSGQLDLQIGHVHVELHSFNIHTSDSIILWIPSLRLLFAGDTLEDTATYIAEAANLPLHQKELQRMKASFAIDKILPAHGDPDRIAGGGYDVSFIDATVRYIAAMTEHVEEPVAWRKSLREVVAEDVGSGSLIYYEQYEEVHKENVDAIRAVRKNA